MAMVHEHCHWDWHLGWTNLSVIMPAWCCTLVPMEVALVLILPGAIGVWLEAAADCFGNGNAPAWCPLWGLPLEATGVALRLAPGLCNSQCAWCPPVWMAMGSGWPLWLWQWLCLGVLCGCLGAWGPGGMGAWVPGCLGASVPGCLGAWVPGCLGAWVPGCLGAWVPEYLRA